MLKDNRDAIVKIKKIILNDFNSIGDLKIKVCKNISMFNKITQNIFQKCRGFMQ